MRTAFCSLKEARKSCEPNIIRFFSSLNFAMSTIRNRGALVVLEGCDRCGKSTQCTKLVNYLRSIGRAVEHMRFPDRTTTIGKSIDAYLQGHSDLEDHAIHLLFAANRWEAVPRITRLLEKGTTIVMDRYSDSGVAFTAAKGLDLTWCKNAEQGLPSPDLVLYLEIPVHKAAERAQFGGERYEKTEFQQQVVKMYELLRNDNWKVLDATKTVEELHQEIREEVLLTEESVKHLPVRTLWMNR